MIQRALVTAALALVCLAVSACTIGATTILEGEVSGVPPDARPSLRSVEMRYGTWETPEAVDLMKPKEQVFIDAVRRGFEKQIAAYKLESGGAALPVTIEIVDLNPGSRAARYWVGFGAGKGYVNARITVGSYGSFTLREALVGGAFGGDFEDCCRELGEEVAGYVAKIVKGEGLPSGG